MKPSESLPTILAGALLLLVGCASPGPVPVGDESSWPRVTERVMDSEVFLEVVDPQPSWVAEERAQLDEWRTADYETDRRRGRQDLEMPEEYRITLDEFRHSPEQVSPLGPYLLLQLRKREYVEGTKEHLVETSSLFSSEPVKAVKKVKVWRRWRWEPTQAVMAGDPVEVVAIEHEFSPGVFSRFGGTFDEQGEFRLYLAPLLQAGASQTKGTTIVLQAQCYKWKKVTEIRIELDAIRHYLQSLAPEGSE